MCVLQDRLFGGRVQTFRQEWAAYPVLTPYPFSEWPRIKLHGSLHSLAPYLSYLCADYTLSPISSLEYNRQVVLRQRVRECRVVHGNADRLRAQRRQSHSARPALGLKPSGNTQRLARRVQNS